MLRKIAVLGLLALLVAPGVTRAYDDEYTPVRKLGRGFAEMTTGFLELPGNMVAVGRTDGAIGAMTLGLAKGIGMIPVRELVGVYDVVTSPIAAPGHYDPVIEPEFPWSYFEDGAPSARLSAAVRGETRSARRTGTSTATSGARR